jgi:hypothetical protein
MEFVVLFSIFFSGPKEPKPEPRQTGAPTETQVQPCNFPANKEAATSRIVAGPYAYNLQSQGTFLTTRPDAKAWPYRPSPYNWAIESLGTPEARLL